jgi:quinoprotein relay system zinc metallohydrolase 2
MENRTALRAMSRAVSRTEFLRGLAAAAVAPLVGGPGRAEPTTFAEEIAPGVFVHQGWHSLTTRENAGDIANCGFIVGADAVAVIDTSGSALMGRLLRACVRSVTDRPIRYVVNTHMHPDHVFGNAAFKPDGPVFVAHHKLARGLAARAERYLAIARQSLGEGAFAGTEIILPDQAVEDRTSLDLGGRSIVLEAQRTAHTDNDLVIRDEATGTLFLGDLLFAGHVPTLDGSIRGWLAVLADLRGRDAARVVPGHGPAAMNWPEALDPLQRYLERVASDVRTMLGDGKTMSEAAKSAGLAEKDAWLLFEEYHARNVSAAFAELEWE